MTGQKITAVVFLIFGLGLIWAGSPPSCQWCSNANSSICVLRDLCLKIEPFVLNITTFRLSITCRTMIKKGVGWLEVIVIIADYSGISRIFGLGKRSWLCFSLPRKRKRKNSWYGGGLQLYVPSHQLRPQEKYLWKSARIKRIHIQVHWIQDLSSPSSVDNWILSLVLLPKISCCPSWSVNKKQLWKDKKFVVD